jgi:GAF domain-containing protein
MKDIGDVIAARERPFAERLNGLLEVVRKMLGVRGATLSYVNADKYVFEAVNGTGHINLQAGEIDPVIDKVCKRVVRTEQAFVARDIEADAPELANLACNISSYIGVPVFVDGELYGTFSFYDTDPRDDAFFDWDLAVVEVLANWVSSELEQRRQKRGIHAATTERPYVTN